MLITGVLLTAPTSFAKDPLVLDGTFWRFPAARATTKARAKRAGKIRLAGFQSVTIRLLPGNAWSGTVEIDTALAGTYARPNESSRRLTLTLDGPSSDALVAAYIEAVEAEAALEGVDVQAALVIDRAKVILVVRPRRATGTATAKLKAKFKLSGTATVAGVGSVPAKVVGKIKGTSELVGLAP